MTFFSALRRSVTLVAAPALLLASILPAHAEVQFQQITSPGGVEAWLVEDYSVPIITIRFAFDGGAAQDPAGKEGLASLMTTLFDEGAGDLDSEAYQIALDEAGAEMGFGSDKDTISGTMRLLADEREAALDLLTLAVQQPRFDQDPINRMRAQLLSSLAADAQNPATAAQKLWNETLFGSHPYARPSEGTPETLKSITAEDLRASYDAMFARSNLHVAIVGAITAEDAEAVLDQVFGDLPAEASLTAVEDIAPALGKDLAVEYPLPQTNIFMAYPGVGLDDPDFFAARVMSEILGGGSVISRLNAEVREKRGLTYGVSASLANMRHSSNLMVSTSTRADRAPETLSVIEDVITRLVEEGPTEEELAAVKKYMIGSAALQEFSSSSAIASTLVGLQLWDLGIDYLPRRTEMIKAVTAEQVQAVAKRLLTEKPAIMLLGPKAAAP
ncbi:MAG: pitrilysin family protein [Candidatus Devosia phytovorans]|uniref:Pitrilysin family protein n=1 Tax=Candidatus Devosia phytovorans TaxID=3121372 RepID=A0AAJ6B0P0_9HYPH|nr:pitrilysin family protein [Devosia sp.]WEK05407.1 MAG: pitrilysin family protein [Devosia sp.]